MSKFHRISIFVTIVFMFSACKAPSVDSSLPILQRVSQQISGEVVPVEVACLDIPAPELGLLPLSQFERTGLFSKNNAQEILAKIINEQFQQESIPDYLHVSLMDSEEYLPTWQAYHTDKSNQNMADKFLFVRANDAGDGSHICILSSTEEDVVIESLSEITSVAPIYELTDLGYVRHLDISPSKQKIAFVHNRDNEIQVSEMVIGEEALYGLNGNNQYAKRIMYLNDDTFAVSSQHQSEIYSKEFEQDESTLQVSGEIQDCNIKNNSCVAVFEDTVQIVDLITGTVGLEFTIIPFDYGLVDIPPGISSLLFDQKGESLVIGIYNHFFIVDLLKSEILSIVKVPFPGEGYISHISVSDDGNYLAIAQRFSEIIYIWDLSTSSIISMLNATHEISSLKYLPNSSQLASGHINGVLTIWDNNSAIFKEKLHTQAVTSIGLLTTEDSIITGSRDGSLKVWSLATFLD